MSSLSPIAVSSSLSASGGHYSDLDGQIQVIFGPMFSGKTTELMRRIRRYTHAKKRCQVIKYKKDTRYDDECASTHDLQKCEARGCNALSELSEESLVDLDVIGIDEGQVRYERDGGEDKRRKRADSEVRLARRPASLTRSLHSPVLPLRCRQFFEEIVEFADRWANRGKVVIIGALDATFERKPFGHILNLIPIAEQVMKLSAVCMLCHRDASFTKRIGSETAVEVIGGADKYLSTCRECFDCPQNSPKPQVAALSSTAALAAAADPSSPSTPLSPLLPAAVSSADDCTASDSLSLPIPSLAVPSACASRSTPSLSSNKRISSRSPNRLRALDTNAAASAAAAADEEMTRKRKGAELASEQDEKRRAVDNKENSRQAVC